MADSDIVFLGYQKELASQTNQGNEHHDRNNDMDLTEASTSNEIQISQLDNGYSPVASIWKGNRLFPPVGICRKIMPADAFQQATWSAADLEPYSLPAPIYFHPLVNNKSTHYLAESSATSTSDPSLSPQIALPIQVAAASSSSQQPKQLNPRNSRNHHKPSVEFTELLPRRINPPRKVKVVPEAAIGSAGAKPANRSAAPSKSKAKSQVGKPCKIQKVVKNKVTSKQSKKKIKWTEHYAPDGRIYFYNHVTMKSSWEKTDELKPQSKNKATSKQSKKKIKWTEHYAPDGRLFFYNHVTKKSSWEKTDELESQPEPQHINPGVAQQESSYQCLLNLDASDLVASTEAAHCPGCLLWVLEGEGVVLKDCLHTFCRKCLQNAILYSKTAQVGCPFANEEYVCESHLQEREVKCIVSPDEYEHHLARSVSQVQSQANDAFHCRTPGCTGWCLFEGGVREFLCPMCHHTNCLVCWDIHEGTHCMGHLFTQDSRDSVSQPANGAEPSSEDIQNCQSLLVLSDVDLVTNKERFDCPICFSDIEVGEGVTLKDCLHNYCRECLAGTVRHSETVLVKCPFVNDEYSCESYIQEREIKCLVTPDEHEHHLARSLALVESQSKNSFHCKTPDCPGWCLVEDDVNWFFCDVCSRTNCLTCTAIHEGKNCRQYQDSLAFQGDTSEEVRKTREYLEEQVKSNNAMECPTCLVIVVKRDGCDWLTCSMCRTEICWATRGPRWGPGGHGDTSGGCNCDYKNKKPCHPKCGYCH